MKRIKKACLGMAVALAASLVATPVLPAAAATYERLTPQHDESVPGQAAGRGEGPLPSTGKPFTAPAPVWPAARTAEVALGAKAARAGDLPVLVSATEAKAPAKVSVEVLDRKTTDASGVDGLLLRVGGAEKSTVRLTVSYADFRYAYGADWASRLRLLSLPDCALKTPGAAECQARPLVSENNIATGEVTADVAVASGLVALAAAPASTSGDYSASPLQPSSTWSAGNNAGSFGWSYPMRVPPAINGPAPTVGLSYSSAAVDGRMAASNNQPSQVGEGFEVSTGFIERRYKPCAKDGGTSPAGVGDLCWKTDNAVLSLNGKSTELIRAADGTWHGRAEDGSKITRSTSSTNGNGDNDGEHWVVTTTDGTQYWFGRNRLPGWVDGKDETNSTWTVRVFGNQDNEPCYNATFTLGHCLQAWRWNLDYVVDPNGNTMSYWYAKETNKYARALDSSVLFDYTRGGYLTRIDYGTRSNTAYGTAPAQVVLTPGDRCLSNCGTRNATNWPDTPWDQECTAAPCLTGSPTFWTSKRLAKVTTRVWGGTAYRDVESWTLTHSFPNPGDGTRAGLWLERISHTGHVGGTATVPDITFVGTQRANRVDATDLSPAMNWWRIAHINTESGKSISVTYSPVDCVRGSRMPDPNALQNNTLRCYPVRWQPPGAANPIWDYFHKYLVTAVTETDLALPSDGRSPRVLTTYDYLGDPAWHYTDDDGLVDDATKTWSVWRGYSRVRTMKGEGAERTRTETVYFRGMHGDKLPSGTRPVELPAAGGAPAVNDEDDFAGMVREEIVYNGPSGGEVSGKVNEPWRSAATATRTIDGVTVRARYVDITRIHGRTTMDGGRAPRLTTAATTYDEYGMAVKQENLGDNAVTGDEQCVVTTYARNITAWLMEYPGREQTFATDCTRAAQTGLTEADVVSDTYTSYDQQGRSVAPTKGAISQVEELKAWPNTYLITARANHDAHGRVKDSWDVRGNKTTTSYTPATGGPVTAMGTTNHLGWTTSSTLEPAWGTATVTVDENDRRTEQAHDGLGRVTAVWLPGRSRSESANKTYTYLVRANGPSVVTTASLTPSGGYVTSHTLYDGHLRPRQTQGPDGGTGRLLTDTFYDSAGRAVKANTGYVADGAPATGLFLPLADAQIPAQTRTSYDGAGRPTAAIFVAKGDEKWRTTTVYGGDRVDTQPPAGAAAVSAFSDVFGRTIRLRQYEAGLGSAAYDDTTYTYNRKGKMTEVVDPAGNRWTYGYDFLGQKTTVDDPDKGPSSMGYNDAGDLTLTTDGRGEKLAYVYDSLGRKTSMHDDTPAGAKRAEWTYDAVAKGHQDSSIRYAGGLAYTDEVTALDDGYRPTSRTITIPTEETGVGGTYTYTYSYHVDGSPATTRLPAVGGLSAERLVHGYDDLGRPNTLRTNLSTSGEDTFLVNGTSYTRFGELGVIGRRYDDGKILDTGSYYEEGTRRLSRILTTRETTPSLVADLNYTRDPAGNVTRIADAASADTQCFEYDHLSRLLQAWTPTNQDCAAARSVAGLGGPGPYWHSFTYDKVGNRLTSTERTTTTTTSRTYTYPAAGADQPHALKTMTTTGAGTSQYTYDLSGNTETQPGPAGQQTLGWDAEGRLSTLAEVNAGNSSYLYDADGNRLIRRDPGGKILYLPGQELRYTASGAGTRYYSHAGQTVGQRTSAGVTWLVGDHQGTAGVSVRATDQAVTARRQTPFGGPRPGSLPTWPNDKGFVGGTKDNTGMTHLGAREYNPTTGRFISVDRLIDYNNPQQMHGYSYASSSPITLSDPSGLVQIGDDYGLIREEPTSGGGSRIVDRRSPGQKRQQGQETFNFPRYEGTKSNRSYVIIIVIPPPKPKPKPSFAPWQPGCKNYVEVDCGRDDGADLAPVPKPSNEPKPRCADGDPKWSSTGACESAWAQHDQRAAAAKAAADNDMCRKATDRMATPACNDVIAHCFLTFHCDYEVHVRGGPPKGDVPQSHTFFSGSACAGFCITVTLTAEGLWVSGGGVGSLGFGGSIGEFSAPGSKQNPWSVGAGGSFGVGYAVGAGTTTDGGVWTSKAVQFGVGWQVGPQQTKELWIPRRES